MTDLVSRADREKRSYCLADIHEKNTALLAEIITEWNGREAITAFIAVGS